MKCTKGKINQVQAQLNDLAVKNAQKQRIKAEYDTAKAHLDKLCETNYKSSSKLLWFGWLTFLVCVLSVVFTGTVFIWYVITALSAVFAITCMIKTKKADTAKLQNEKQKGFFESKLEFLKSQYQVLGEKGMSMWSTEEF